MALVQRKPGTGESEQYVRQLPDGDPLETQEWVDSLSAVAEIHGRSRARFLVSKLLDCADQLQIGQPATVSTPYVNTIPLEDEPWFPGDEAIERRIRAHIRWNAAAMVMRANATAEGIGGHLSTFASSAALYEVGFNHFFRGKDGGLPGDHVYFQGHAAPGIYARAFLEGRLSEDQLDRFRREIGGGLSSYPHPRLMPEFWEYPTVSMGLGPLCSIYQARFNQYLHNRRIDDTSQSRVWCFIGDGECDEPETLGSISLAAREGLEGLTWVINCNLQRLDGPVRGNGKIIQELEAVFRGAGWHVIKVIWGREWDDLLARDHEGVLLAKMNSTLDGEFQRYATEDGAYIREHFFGPDPRLRRLVDHLDDEALRALPRGGHDYRKLYAAYKAATLHTGGPTVVLVKTVKGWTLGSAVEGRNATHQVKKLTNAQLLALRDRLHLHDAVPDGELNHGNAPPYIRLREGGDEHRYLIDRRRALDGPLPSRKVTVRQPLTLPSVKVFDGFDAGSGTQRVSTTAAFTRLLRDLCRDPSFGERVVPIIPDEGRTFGMDGLFKEFGIYASQGQLYEPVDHDLLLSYTEAQDGQILEEGITEAGSLASFIAAGTSYATRGVPMVPFFTFYSMFGFQRVGDLIWQAADARARGFLCGATAGRTTLAGEGLQHQDGHSHVLASTIPVCEAFDPAFAYEVAAIVRVGLERMYGSEPEDIFHYLTLYNEPYAMPPRPGGLTDEDIYSGLYRWAQAPAGPSHSATILFSGPTQGAAREAATELTERWDVSAELWSVTSYKRLREEALDIERHNRLHPGQPALVPLVTQKLATASGPIVAVTDYMRLVPDQISRWIPSAPRRGRAATSSAPASFTSLGTDGFGRSDTREHLRRFFEIDAPSIVVAVLSGLAASGQVSPSIPEDAIEQYGLQRGSRSVGELGLQRMPGGLRPDPQGGKQNSIRESEE